MKRLLALGLVVGLFGSVLAAPADKAEREKVKEALRELQDFIGGWKGSGGPDKPRPGPRDPIWSETVQWAWRFKGDDAWLTVDIKGSKFFKGGEVRYLPAKKLYELTATTAEGKKLVFEGKLKDETLTFDRVDPASKEAQQLKMNLAGDGVRFIYRFARKADGGTIWKKEFMVATTKIGESLGKKEKGPECVVSGGRGTQTVTHLGETYYVCCSGCADAFRENPKKYIDEYKAKKARK
jgi:hypothetical protein